MSKTNGHAGRGVAPVTSPRFRGEVDRAKRGRVRGALRESECVESPPHPDPLPASGARERTAAADLLSFAAGRRFATILADPPWQFTNRTGKMAPEHKRLSRYGTMKLDEIMALPVEQLAAPTAHLYLWCPNAMLPDGLAVMKAWGFTY
jgi:hypothetical protein